MSRSIRWALIFAGVVLSQGCAYEFGIRRAMRDVQFRKDAMGLMELHDLEKGPHLMIILRDQVPGLNVDTGNTLKLNIEIHEFKIGEPIDVDSNKAEVRFSDLDGMPRPYDGRVGYVAKGTLTILKVTERGLLFECDMEILMEELKGGDSSWEELELRYSCAWLPPDPDQIPPFLGGNLEDVRDDLVDPRDRNE